MNIGIRELWDWACGSWYSLLDSRRKNKCFGEYDTNSRYFH